MVNGIGVQGVSIRLEGPICNCSRNNLESKMYGHMNSGRVEIWVTVRCNTCGTEIKFSPSKFTLEAILKTPYPETKLLTAGRQVLTPEDKIFLRRLRIGIGPDNTRV